MSTAGFLAMVEQLEGAMRLGKPQATRPDTETAAGRFHHLHPTEAGTISVVDIDGPLVYESGSDWFYGDWMGTKEISDLMRRQDQNPEIVGHKIRVNTPGGNADAAQVLLGGVLDMKKPVSVHVIGTMASGGVWGTAGADLIMADSAAEIGSVGVMMNIPKWLKIYYEQFDRMRADTSPDKNEDLEQWIKGNRQPFIDQLNTMDAEFMRLVRTYRPLKGHQSTIENTLAGGMFPAPDAQRRGLIDTIGTFGDSVSALEEIIRKKQGRKSKPTLSKMTIFQVIAALVKGKNLVVENDDQAMTALEEVKTTISELETQVGSLTTERDGLQAQVTAVTGERNAAREQVTQLSTANEQLAEANGKHLAEVADAKTKLGTANGKIAELTAGKGHKPIETKSGGAAAEEMEKQVGKILDGQKVKRSNPVTETADN
jgi:ClpP class serine protease